ncbi:unnamed protein product [marine sediment metagenome]|uniref:Uncharacterized protein n=1 Tax=marine sediment metagenome TaxID=412755 RepID=X1HQ54_9ZZZZ
MIRVYFLPVETIDGTESVAGIEYIHDALLECTEEPDVRKLIQDTTDIEHVELISVEAYEAVTTQEDIDHYHALVSSLPLNPDRIRAGELLSSSPAVITIPEMWELMRIFGRLHGIIT